QTIGGMALDIFMSECGAQQQSVLAPASDGRMIGTKQARRIGSEEETLDHVAPQISQTPVRTACACACGRCCRNLTVARLVECSNGNTLPPLGACSHHACGPMALVQRLVRACARSTLATRRATKSSPTTGSDKRKAPSSTTSSTASTRPITPAISSSVNRLGRNKGRRPACISTNITRSSSRPCGTPGGMISGAERGGLGRGVSSLLDIAKGWSCLDRKGIAAAAARLGVGIADLEGGAAEILDEIDLGSLEQLERGLVDHH